MAKKYYQNVDSLKTVDELITAAERSLQTSAAIYTTSSNAPEVLKKSLLAVSGVGAVAAASAGIGATSAGVAGLAGAASFTGASIGTVGAIGAGALLAPVVIPAAILSGIGYILFKSKKQKELRQKVEYRLKKAVTLQNETIQKLKLYMKKLEHAAENLYEENMKLRQKIDELMAINEALMNEIHKMTSDLS
ncbi:hypothetical protein [Metabacillus iocasae]|uniref:Uncharacterized protein HemX n=1 Tax=Priestia iocasae TaxID=2291674 RepID=A0ABS2QTW7_9BACI|nr:hypothetical protein [Metabacillus iocasae]MBM7702911.1 uncharacterized protein HemX [Metabacillus iocasae]